MTNVDPNVNPESFEADFNLEDEYKPDPLCPQGTYKGHVTQVSFNAEQQSINWRITLKGNEGVMSDGNSAIDGTVLYYSNWLPRPGDKEAMSSNGRSTKHQSKVNMLTQFAQNMKLDMNDKHKVAEALSQGLWLGIPVICKVGIRNTPDGRAVNEISKMMRDSEGEVIVPKDEMPF